MQKRILNTKSVALTLFTACSKKAESSASTPSTSTTSNTLPAAAGFADWGSSKAEIIAKLEKVKAKVISDSGDVVVAELAPAGLTSSDGKPVTSPLRMEYHFKGGKLAEMKTGL